MKLLFLLLSVVTFSFAIDGVKNVKLNTMDASEVNELVSKRLKKIDLKHLKSNSDYKKHINNINNLQSDIKSILVTQNELRGIDEELKDKLKKYNGAQGKYTKKMAKLYSANRNLTRTIYYIVSYPLDVEYMDTLKNQLVDKYAIEKIEQNTEIKESSKGMLSYKNVVSTTKSFGEMQVDTLKDITFRNKNLNIKILKVVQSPFVNSKETTLNKATTKKIDKFDETADAVGVKEVTDFDMIEAIYLPKLMLSGEEISKVMKPLKSNINIKKANKKLTKSSQKIIKAIKKIEKQHDKYIKNLNSLSINVNTLTTKQAQKSDTLEQKITEANKIAKYYSIELNLEELYKLIIITPKLYSSYVELGEEKDFIKRKVKSYLSKLTITELEQSETLTNYVDLNTKNLSKSKLVEYESIHFFPFVQGNELATLVFGVIKLEDKISASDYVTKELKYSTLEFVPVKKGFKTIFAATTEVTLGTVKEFLETHRINKYFDKYCIEDSLLPDDAKNFKNLDEEFYDYPAVCFKVQRVEEFMTWLGKKVGKDLTFATPSEWSYVASNASSSEYCWGNAEIAELNEDGLKPENIYYEDSQDTTLQPIKKFEKSLLGMYDMCGNVHELVKDGDEFMLKGNSYISFIESSNAPALEYDKNLNAMIGLRAFYILEK